MMPQRKVTAAGLGGAASVLICVLLKKLAGFDLGVEGAAALTTLLAFAAGWSVKS